MRTSNGFARILFVALLAVVAAGCGDDSSDNGSSTAPATTAAAAAAPATTAAAAPATTAAAAPATTAAAAPVVEYEAPPEDSSIGYAWSIPLKSLDPHATPSNFDPIYIGLAYDTLIVREFDGTFSPMLATSWEFVEPDVLELKLREGVTFHGGRAFDAEAVVLNFERVTTAESSTRGGPLAAAIASVEAIDSMTVRMTLGDGPGVIFGALSSMGGMMINPDAFDTDLSVTADGTGPYRVTQVLAAESVTFKRFEDTWAPEDARVSNLKIVTNKDSAQRVNLLLTGDVDATNIDTHQIEMLEEKGYTTHFRVGEDAFVMQLNWERIPDVAARQAIESSIDRALILEGIHKGVSEAGGQVQTMGDPAYNSDVSPDPDIQRAIQLAADSGLKGSTLQLMTAGVPNLEAYAQAIQPMLEQLGVTVEITLVEWGQLNPEWATGNYDLSLIYFTGNSDLALSYDALLGADSALNPAGVAPGGIDALIAATFSETNPEVRIRQFSELAAAVDEQAVVGVLVHPVQPIVTAPGIEINADRLRLFGGFNLRGIHRVG